MNDQMEITIHVPRTIETRIALRNIVLATQDLYSDDRIENYHILCRILNVLSAAAQHMVIDDVAPSSNG